MKEKVKLFAASFLMAIMLMLAPSIGDAAMLRPSPESGSNEFGQILDDFMLKETLTFGKYYTVEKKYTNNGVTTYVIQQGAITRASETLEISANSETGFITKFTYRFFLPTANSNMMESIYNSWGAQVKQRYGNPTEEGRTEFGHPYGKFIENGKYKYRIASEVVSGLGHSTAASRGSGIFTVEIEAL